MKKQRQNNALIKNALIISMGGLIVKILGAFYRIPLTNLLKTEGLGIYQTAFPTYLILMTFTGAAATTTMTGLISAGENGKTYSVNRSLFLTARNRRGGVYDFLFGRSFIYARESRSERFVYCTRPVSYFRCRYFVRKRLLSR